MVAAPVLRVSGFYTLLGLRMMSIDEIPTELDPPSSVTLAGLLALSGKCAQWVAHDLLVCKRGLRHEFLEACCSVICLADRSFGCRG